MLTAPTAASTTVPVPTMGSAALAVLSLLLGFLGWRTRSQGKA
ncbi:IPTL-CTERM sorting domain-containing protein [Ottowia sp.]